MEEDQIEEAIEDCLNALPAVNCPFNEWEYDFVESVEEVDEHELGEDDLVLV